MHQSLLELVKKYAMISKDDRLLLAVSGGVDSMVMWDLVDEMGVDYEVAHCNFQLRGEASDGDEEFVKLRTKERGVPFHVNRFQTKEYAKDRGLSIQMAARDLRYEWFNHLLDVQNFDKLLTAHHADDSIETFFINLLRGSSAKGLQGIKKCSGKVLRPLLFMSRTEIEEYAKERSISWREDESNTKLTYQRNFIRHE